MKCTWSLCRLLVCGLLGCCLAVSGTTIASPRAGEKAKAASGAPMSEEQMMAEIMKLATPGPNHELLKKFVGSWTTVTRMWTGPGEPQSSEGTAECSLILGGRFVKQEFKGTFMGNPYEGYGLTGYDNKKGRYITNWVDVLGTGFFASDGTYDAAAREMTFKGAMDLVGPPIPYRMVNKLVDDNSYVFSMYEMREGKEVKSMEITYRRK